MQNSQKKRLNYWELKMIDVSKLTPEEISNLKQQLEEHERKNNLKGYHVSFIVRFDPKAHVDDALTFDGDLDIEIFREYIYENIVFSIIKDFNLGSKVKFETCSYPQVRLATTEELEIL